MTGAPVDRSPAAQQWDGHVAEHGCGCPHRADFQCRSCGGTGRGSETVYGNCGTCHGSGRESLCPTLRLHAEGHALGGAAHCPVAAALWEQMRDDERVVIA